MRLRAGPRTPARWWLPLLAVGAVVLARGADGATPLAPTAPGSPGSLDAPRVLIDGEGRRLPVLRGGWSLSLPYQYLAIRNPTRVEGTIDELSGIDIEVATAVARAAGFSIEQTYRPRGQHLAELRGGDAEIAYGVVRPAGDDPGIRYSRPYRQSRIGLAMRRGEAQRRPLRSAAELASAIERGDLRIAFVVGTRTGESAIDTLLLDPQSRPGLLAVDNEFEGLRALVAGEVDALLADEMAAATTASRGGWILDLQLHPLHFDAKARFAFSERSVPPETIARFDEAIARLEASGDLQRLIARQRLPAMLGPVLDRPWFMLLDIVGTVAFALSGLLIAVRERYSVLGALVLASLPAVGGGVLRDLLVGREPIAILASPLPLMLVFGTVLGGFVVVRGAAILRRSRLGGQVADRVAANPAGRSVYEFCDAIGLAAFTITGVAVAISTYAQPLWIWGPLLAGLTAAGGGILRELVRQAGGIESLKTSFYGEVPLLWGLLLSVYLLWEGLDLDHREFAVAIVVTVVGALATRIFVVVRGVRPPGFAE